MRFRSAAFALVLGLVSALAPVGARAASGTLTEPPSGPETFTSHLTLGLGVQMFTSEDFDEGEFDQPAMARFAYRYAVKPAIEAAFDLRVSRGSTSRPYALNGAPEQPANLTYTTVWVGAGMRAQKAEGVVRPYLQVDAYLVKERFDVEILEPFSYGDLDQDSGPGFGVQGGAELMLSPSISIPIEASFLSASPRRDLTSFGFGAGLTFGF
jgi:hypothetical protein